MKTCSTKAETASLRPNKACCVGALLLAFHFFLFGSLRAEAQSQATPTEASQTPVQPHAESQAESKKAAQARKMPQEDARKGQSSATDTTRKPIPDKNKLKPKHVFTNDDLSGIGGGISVVGNDPSEGSSAVTGVSSESSRRTVTPPATGSDETVWRARARAIQDQIAGVDQQISKVKQEIAKSGSAAFDPTVGLSQNVIVIHDRNAELQSLQDRKQNLERQLDDLADEGRKAGADPGWFR